MCTYEIMLNILIGVSSGIFSSIIVSTVFYVITNERSYLDEAKRMVYPLYSLVICSMLNKQENSYEFNSKKMLKNAIDESMDYFSTFEPWKYKGKLKKILIAVNEFISDGSTRVAIDKLDFSAIEEKAENLTSSLEDYEKNFWKHCFKIILSNIVIKITLTLWLFIALATIILNLF